MVIVCRAARFAWATLVTAARWVSDWQSSHRVGHAEPVGEEGDGEVTSLESVRARLPHSPGRAASPLLRW